MGIETALLGPMIVGGLGLAGAATQAGAAKSAAQTSASAADRAAELQRQMFERQVELQEPWRQAGINALTKLQTAAEYTPFGVNQFQQDPGYAFRLAEGQKALERSAAARGGLISGNALRAAQRYGQEMGSQEYQNAFNRYQAERQARLGPLQSLAGLGQTSTNALTGAAGTYGTTVGNIYQGQGANEANMQLARGSAYGGALGGLANYLGRTMGQPTYQYGMPYSTPGGYMYGPAAGDVGPPGP